MKNNSSIWIVLMLFTILSALAATNLMDFKYLTLVILGFAVLKFIGVAFYFMEIKDAHPFWKAILLIFLSIFSIITLMLV